MRGEAFSSHTQVLPHEVPPSEMSAWRAVVRVLRSTAHDTVSCLSTVFLPSPCRLCGQPLSEITRVPVCSSCWKHLPAQPGTLCHLCGERLPRDSSAESTEQLCPSCSEAEPPFAQAVAHGVYEGSLRELLHLLKYERMEPIAARLAAMMASHVLAMRNLPSSLKVVPVPLHRGRRRERGFNQAELLARGIVQHLRQQRPAMRIEHSAGVLERRRATESQAGLSPNQRRVNVRGAFFVPEGRAQAAIQGCDVLLIDDIYTTGATARACSLALRRAGAASVRVATVARAQRMDALRQPIGFAAQFAAQEDEFAVTAEQVSEQERPMHEDVAFWDTSDADVGEQTLN
jgi:ComF family protein